MADPHLLPGQKEAGIFPRFYLKPLQNNYRSEREGHPIFDDVEMVEIIIAGDKFTQVDERVKDEHKARWPREYAAFRDGLEVSPEGYPIAEWPPLTPAQVANLKALNVHTVEALAGLSDAQIGNIGLGGRQLRDRAAAWLEQAATGAAVDKALADSAEKDLEIGDLKRQVADLQGSVAKLLQSKEATNV